ncbi:hypothetical protein [Gemmatimonas sp.]|uniref:hypothetical protein n=1 Tax=Gemmatimonas sp. TaxID=1962908 RepID=UPI0039835F16
MRHLHTGGDLRIGEFGSCGVAASLANAVYSATGVRDDPLTLYTLLEQMQALA